MGYGNLPGVCSCCASNKGNQVELCKPGYYLKPDTTSYLYVRLWTCEFCQAGSFSTGSNSGIRYLIAIKTSIDNIIFYVINPRIPNKIFSKFPCLHRLSS
jgi:hypothetical protein